MVYIHQENKNIKKKLILWMYLMFFEIYKQTNKQYANYSLSSFAQLLKQLFSKDYIAAKNNTLRKNRPLLPGQKIWRTLYKQLSKNVLVKWYIFMLDSLFLVTWMQYVEFSNNEQYSKLINIQSMNNMYLFNAYVYLK